MGKLYWLERGNMDQPGADRPPDLPRAVRESADYLTRLARQAEAAGSGAGAQLFDSYAMLVRDVDFTGAIQSRLAAGQTPASAVEEAGQELARRLSGAGNPYLQSREGDIRWLCGLVLDRLVGRSPEVAQLCEPVILAAEELSPAELMELAGPRLLGLALARDCSGGHTAILAQTMGIPAACALGSGLRGLSGQRCSLSGEAGELTAPPKAVRPPAPQAGPPLEERPSQAGGMKVYCNISRPEDVERVLARGGAGIGLYRSEFLFLGRSAPPSEEEQYLAYRQVVSDMRGREVVIRTLDVGEDKPAPYLDATGSLRGIRLLLARPEVLCTQLRALYRASAWGRLSILLPMVTGPEEVAACREHIAQVQHALGEEGLAFDPEVPLGVMIETPAAVLLADALGQSADFFSLGTNDLTQGLFGLGRRGAGDGWGTQRHPALLRALEQTAAAAHRAGIPVGICGALGGAAEWLELFLELGLDYVSVPPGAVEGVRQALAAAQAGQKESLTRS